MVKVLGLLALMEIQASRLRTRAGPDGAFIPVTEQDRARWDPLLQGHVFERRYDMAVVTEEEGAQIERLAYTLANGVKGNLVERVRDWPGVQSGRALLDGEPLTGHWFERTREYAARNRRQSIESLRFATEESVLLTVAPLPAVPLVGLTEDVWFGKTRQKTDAELLL